MPEELGTKDVLEQVNIRLGNVEQDMREFRTESNARFDRVYQEFGVLRNEMNQKFMWLFGLMVAVLLSTAGLWFK